MYALPDGQASKSATSKSTHHVFVPVRKIRTCFSIVSLWALYVVLFAIEDGPYVQAPGALQCHDRYRSFHTTFRRICPSAIQWTYERVHRFTVIARTRKNVLSEQMHAWWLSDGVVFQMKLF